MKSRHLRSGLISWSLLALTACSHDEFHSEFHSFRGGIWNKDDVVRFEIPVTDTLTEYNVLVEVRNKNTYQFRNLWLFIDLQTPDKSVRRDTVNYELADAYGQWYGNGINLYMLSLPFEQSVRYPVSGTYTYSIRQGMRENSLEGISDIGLKILKNGGQ